MCSTEGYMNVRDGAIKSRESLKENNNKIYTHAQIQEEKTEIIQTRYMDLLLYGLEILILSGNIEIKINSRSHQVRT